MWRRISLRNRLFVILGVLVMLTLAGGSVMIWYTHQMEALFKDVVDTDLRALQAAQGLENALVNQKGFVSYYFLDGDPSWLEKLGEYRQAFKERLNKVRGLVQTTTVRDTIGEIESEYAGYIKDKDRVITLYRSGKREVGAKLHKKVRKQFFKLLELCENYKDLHARKIQATRLKTQSQAKRLRIIAGTAIWTAIILGALLAFVLITQILNPLRNLALHSNLDAAEGSIESRNEVKAVSRRFHSLVEDMDETKTQLERSQEHLVQSEKLALVGKLAAGMAHSIRNPLTSVKMRLFSLGRSLDVSDTQKEDLDVISEEIRHLDNIVRNFLEFSRPPKLKKQNVSPSDVVDMVLQLLHHRLQSYGAEVKLHRQERLPEVSIDPEQLKEVLVNLVVNACEATGGPVQIVISEEHGAMEPWGQVVRLQVTDNGPGIPEEIQNRLFEPFFTTKEEGTGLGLSIAARILQEHGGQLDVNSKEDKGTTFTITLPCREE
jgi:signal transduction histidine kinase